MTKCSFCDFKTSVPADPGDPYGRPDKDYEAGACGAAIVAEWLEVQTLLYKDPQRNYAQILYNDEDAGAMYPVELQVRYCPACGRHLSND